MRRSLILIALFLEPPATSAAAQSNQPGTHIFGSEAGCRASGKVSDMICSNAALNAEAEFREKAPRFSSRPECERMFRQGCSVGISGAAGWAGKKSGIYFHPRQTGFAVEVRSNQSITVSPLIAGNIVRFGARSALSRDLHIDYRATQVRYAAPFGGALERGGGGPGGALPPRPPMDPNFDCSSVIEPDGKDASTACYPAPKR